MGHEILMWKESKPKRNEERERSKGPEYLNLGGLIWEDLGVNSKKERRGMREGCLVE